MAERILLCLAHMSGQEMRYIEEAFRDNWVVPLGPNVNAFEEDLKRFIGPQTPAAGAYHPDGNIPRRGGLGGPEVVALSSGTAAVHLALLACGVEAGDEVVCQSFTFCASCHPITYLGAKPVLMDSEEETWNMDPELLEVAIKDRIEKTGRKPKAIVVVYLYGMPAKIDEILKVAEKYDIPLIEDAAEGLGSRYKGQVCGTFGRYGVLSFNGNKMITTSGGGALICPDKEAKQKIMFYATQARESYPYYQHEEIGYNYRMSNICAGIGRGQMTILDDHIRHHQMLARFYEEAFAEIPGITFHGNPQPMHNAQCIVHNEPPIYDSNFWLNTILIDPSVKVKGEEEAYKEVITGAVGGAAGVTHAAKSSHTDCEPNRNVEALRLALDREGIESRPLWKPMHKQPVYRDVPFYGHGPQTPEAGAYHPDGNTPRRGGLGWPSVSESLFARGLCLPSGPWVTLEHAKRIVDIIRESILG
ncbi:MAG: aminotransferase class I/II-fold pyridoxal phosphate-dependent enzyme [Bacteroidales bacterium]|nr:aminotransferase class I/II-fold pyridoxal phosphate-dependent enzyme [Bacteroidales bacterium]